MEVSNGHANGNREPSADPTARTIRANNEHRGQVHAAGKTLSGPLHRQGPPLAASPWSRGRERIGFHTGQKAHEVPDGLSLSMGLQKMQAGGTDEEAD